MSKVTIKDVSNGFILTLERSWGEEIAVYTDSNSLLDAILFEFDIKGLTVVEDSKKEKGKSND